MPRWDGVSRFLYEIIPKLKDKFEIEAIVPNYGKTNDTIKIKKVPLMKLKVNDYQIARFDFSIKNDIKSSDIVFINSIDPIGALSILYSKKYNKPTIVYLHSIDWALWSKSIGFMEGFLRKIFLLYAKWLYNKSTIIIVPYKEVIEILNKNGIKKPDFTVVSLGVNTENFSPVDKNEKKEIRKKYDLDNDKIIIGYVGRVTREKGINILLEAFESLKRENDNIQLLVAGKGIPNIVNPLKEKPGVIYREFNDDSSKLIKALDIFVMPSLIETTSLVTLEAMSCEKIVIASSVGYVKQYIEDKENGFLFNRGNSSQLKIKLDFAIKNIDKLEKLKKRARETVLNRFNWSTTAEKIIKVVNEF